MKVYFNTKNTPAFQGIYDSRVLQSGLKFAAKNSALFPAAVSLVLSTVARPIVILATPNTDNENKKFACAKSFSSSIVGYILMLLASTPLAQAVKKIDKNPSEFLKQTTIENLKTGAKSLQGSKKYQFATQLFKLGLGFIIAAPKSIITCALIPLIMKKLFRTKNQNSFDQQGKDISFAGSPVKPLEKLTSKSAKLIDKGYEKLARKIGGIIDTSFVQKTAEKLSGTNYEQHMINASDALLTATFIQQVHASKKIENTRKKALIYNAGISTGLSIAGSYTLSKLLNKPTEKFIKKFAEVNKKLPELEKCLEGIKIAKASLILGGIYYIIIPVISTFLADKFDKTGNKV